MNFIERVDPDVIQPYRNVVDDTYEVTGLKNYVEANNLGICFFSPIKRITPMTNIDNLKSCRHNKDGVSVTFTIQ